MAPFQEQAIEWLHGLKSTQENPTCFQAACACVPTIPLPPVGMLSCPACESVLCDACGHCHLLDAVPFSLPDCPSDHDDLGANCAAWYQALNAVTTVQPMSEESEEEHDGKEAEAEEEEKIPLTQRNSSKITAARTQVALP